MDDVKNTTFLSPEPTPTVMQRADQSEDPQTVAPSDPVSTETILQSEDPERAVYDGDISDSILAKLSAYYNEHGSGDYCIYRPSQYSYILLYGSYSNGSYTGTRVTYTLSGNYYSSASLSVSGISNFQPDLSGSTGYIYSNADQFLPSRYIDGHSRSTQLYMHVSTVCIALGLLLAIIGIMFGKIRRRWL